MKRLKVCVVTGTRAEFGIWRSVLQGIRASKKLELQLVATGMHLQKEFGNTVKDIENAGFLIAKRVVMYHKRDTSAESLARGIVGLAKAFRELQPDMVMVLGDRLEILAAASAALAEQIPLAHLHGGETAPGQWDEQIRHAVTKMAHLHFCATKVAGERILRMGEEKKNIHVVGAPALDAVKKFALAHPKLKPRHDPMAPILVLLHPSGKDEALEDKRARMMIAAIGGRAFSILGPNNDPGHKGILRAYEALPMTMSLKQDDFWKMLSQASLLIGNSSAGILEAASLGCPVVNLGDRQTGRQRNENVIDVPWESGVKGIKRAILRAQTDEKFLHLVDQRKNLYGDGHAAQRIVAVLEKMSHDTISAGKSFAD